MPVRGYEGKVKHLRSDAVSVSLSESPSLKKFLSQEYDSSECYRYANVTTMATMVEDRISVSFQYHMKLMTNAATKVAIAVKVNPTFSERPS